MVDVQVTQVRAPLTQFQATKFDKSDVFKLVKSINKNSKVPIREDILERTFDALWPQLKEDIEIEIKSYADEGKSHNKPADIESLNASMGDLIESVQSLREDVRRNSSARHLTPAVARDMRRVSDIIEESKDDDGDIFLVGSEAAIVIKLTGMIANHLERQIGVTKRRNLAVFTPEDADEKDSSENI